ncbi:MAG: lipopolysaccharide heptosyltransferase I [Betaproteobacteria bacterium RIFCSPLOWO2_02_FULL_62_17]|nr:MAG: lipopolysaccharide heptosyltransferase I [Betaproteobacteria bacterium RIFCSPLOWO2_02_FULL_62_17]
MRKILLIKTSSLGDVVHNFPAVSDIRRNFPDAVIDWVVEEAYLPLVALHPGVRRGIPVAIRRWRRRPLRFATWTEIGKLRQTFKHDHYDAVIDTQGLIKSALLAAAAQGRRHGFDAASAREPIAARFYDVCHHIARGQHAVVRNRELAARALGYRCGEAVDYGLRNGASHINKTRERRIVLLHSTSRANKHWPEDRWAELGKLIEAAGAGVVLPWGSRNERLRSERIASSLRHAQIPGVLSMQAVAALLEQCNGVAGLDTGLTHLAAALETPVAAIYCATNPGLTGVYGARRARNLGGPGRAPQARQVFEALQTCGAL